MDLENKYNTLERQTELLEMMKDIHRFLTERNISYSLYGGNLLGAIREQGFIPWDDDIDIMLDRTNYEKFLECCAELSGYKVTKLLWVNRIQKNLSTSEKCNPWHIPTIDIFVFDNVPDNFVIYKIKVCLLRLLQNMMKKKPKANKYSPVKRIPLLIAHYFGKLFTMKFKQKMYDKISQIGNKKKTKYVGCFNDLYTAIGKKYNSDTLDKLQLHTYEDTMFYITSDYHNCLTTAYGDYMTPPKKENRRPLHMS